MNHSWLALCLTVAATSGCGYTTKPLLRANVSSVYVPIFDNQTFRRGLEDELTEAIRNQILFKTQLRIADRERADSILTGEIIDFRESVLLENVADEPIETNVIVYVKFQWKDLRTGRVLVSEDRLSASTRLVIPSGETVASATAESFDDLAEKIIERMEEDW